MSIFKVVVSLNNRLARFIGSQARTKVGKILGITVHYSLLVTLFYQISGLVVRNVVLSSPVVDMLFTYVVFMSFVLMIPAVSVIHSAHEYQLQQKHVASALVIILTGFVSYTVVEKIVDYGIDSNSLVWLIGIVAYAIFQLYRFQTKYEK
ncbi:MULTISPECIES: hypothetical protein [Brevibacillus]|uniref:hypothetical protein n=1 Tax=Brevibacillus TaxID=55080 RepID=UPI00203EBA80|nr:MULTISPECIES: hypothetical protein [Brevibacillus]MCM3625622.1 hypothetical protein [Brevibacillus borstelensis]MDH4620035.1 hypothetical protein [Brevibacillus sp. AY1]